MEDNKDMEQQPKKRGRKPKVENKIEDKLLFADMKRASKVDTESILFNIDARGEKKSDPNAILNAFIKIFDEHRGLCNKLPGVANMERLLIKDGFYDKFITLGAKKYFYEENGEKHITVSGVPKNAVQFFDSIEDFKTEVVIPPYLKGKKIVQYNDNQKSYTFKDGYTNIYKYGINIRPASTSISTTQEYLSLIDGYNC